MSRTSPTDTRLAGAVHHGAPATAVHGGRRLVRAEGALPAPAPAVSLLLALLLLLL